jgi:stage V sporulation protein S
MNYTHEHRMERIASVVEMDDADALSVHGSSSTIKVSAKSRSTAVAGAIAAVIREQKHAEVQAIGAGAVNQAVKALAIARGYLLDDTPPVDIVCTPYFTDVDIEGQERTAVRFIVEPRSSI